jgi:phage terminase large subunit
MTQGADTADIELPEKLRCLFEPHRYIILYGGRGGAKSWGIARALLIQGAAEKRLVVCAREIQKSIQDSVHRLLADQIARMGLESFYEIQQTRIIGANGSEFIFAGLRHNVANIKSLEGADDVWVEEGQAVSKHSWDTLVPTIRKPGSRIIVSFNPDLEDDETYQRFVVNRPTNSKVVKVGWQDNPWFPEVLKQEKDDLKARDPQAYEHVWEGNCKQAVDGAVFADEIQKAAEQNRITRVPAAAGIPVHTFWDLGRSDNTAIWFAQLVGMEYRLLDYYQANGRHMSHFIDVLAERKYNYGDHWLPHDAENEQLSAEYTIKQQLDKALRDNSALGKTARIVPKLGIHEGINAARSIFERCVFDKDKTTDGLQCLRRYRYERDEETGKISKNPVHDMYSHGADAFRYLAVALKKERPKTQMKINTKWVK